MLDIDERDSTNTNHFWTNRLVGHFSPMNTNTRRCLLDIHTDTYYMFEHVDQVSSCLPNFIHFAWLENRILSDSQQVLKPAQYFTIFLMPNVNRKIMLSV